MLYNFPRWRRLISAAAALLVIPGLALLFLQTGYGRRWALGRLQAWAHTALGVDVVAGSFDYRPLSSTVELSNLSLRRAGNPELAPFLRAGRVVVRAPVLRVLRGRIEAARALVDGLSIDLVTDRLGRTNWPSATTPGGGDFRAPSIHANRVSVCLSDQRSGLRVQLLEGVFSSSWAAGESAIRAQMIGGFFERNGVRVPIDLVDLKSSMTSAGIRVHDLYVSSGPSWARIGGSLHFASLSAIGAANLTLDLNLLSRLFQPDVPVRGILDARMEISGRLDDLQVRGDIRSAELNVGVVRLEGLATRMNFDSGAEELAIGEVSARVFGGRLLGSGRVRMRAGSGHSEILALVQGVDTRSVARTLGADSSLAVRSDLRVSASWPGADWQNGSLNATVRALSTQVSVHLRTDARAIRGFFAAATGDVAQTEGTFRIGVRDKSLSGRVWGGTTSIAQLRNALGRVFARPTDPANDAVDGAAEWRAALAGSWARPIATIAVAARDVSVGKLTGVGLNVNADYVPGRIAVRASRVSLRDQFLTFSGQAGLGGKSRLALRGRLEKTSLSEVAEALGVSGAVDGVASADISIDGFVARPAAEISLISTNLAVYGQRFSKASVRSAWADGRLTLMALTAEQDHGDGDTGHIQAAGSFEPGTGHYTIDAAGTNFRPGSVSLPGNLPIAGSWEFSVSGAGMWSSPSLRVAVTGTDVHVGPSAVGEVRGLMVADNTLAKVALAAPELSLRADATVTLAGKLPFEAVLEASDAHVNLPVANLFDATVRAGGLLAGDELRSFATLRKLRFKAGDGEIASEGPTELSYEDGRVRVRGLRLKSGSSVLDVDGEAPLGTAGPAGTVAVRGQVRLESLADLLPATRPFRPAGMADVDVRVDGSAGNWSPRGSIVIGGGQFRVPDLPFGFEAIGGRVELTDRGLRVDPITAVAGSAAVRLSGFAPLEMVSGVFRPPEVKTGRSARFSIECRGLRVSHRAGDEEITATATAAVSGEADALSWERLRAIVDVSELGVTARGLDLQRVAPARIRIADGVASLDGVEVKDDHVSVTGSGSMGLAGDFPLEIDLAARGDVAAVSRFFSPVETAGAVRIDAHVGGSATAPRFSGAIELDGGSFSLRAPALTATAVRLRAALEGDRVTIGELNGSLNGGSVRGSGQLSLRPGNAVLTDVSLAGENVSIEYPAGLKTSSRFALKLVSRNNKTAIEGSIDVQEGYYDAAFDLFSGSARGPASAQSAAPSLSAQPPLELDVRVGTTRPVEMDNNLGRLTATADLRVTGSAARPRLSGAIRLEQDGKLYFGDRIYYIDRGTIRFRDSAAIQPDFDVHAYTRAGDYLVRLGLTGGLNDLTTTLTSDPPLSRNDVISVLLTGKTAAENRGLDVRTLEAFSLATGALNASLSSRLHRRIGVSRVGVQPAAIAAESNSGSRITITQDFTQAMRLMYSMNLSDSDDQIWVAEYDLTRHFTTRAVKQSDNTYRGEFRHDIRFGAGSSASDSGGVAKRRSISAVRFADTGPFASARLAEKFKVKPGQRYNAVKVRQGAERVRGFLAKQGYLESRVRIDREESGADVVLTGQLELGPVVQLTFSGSHLPRKIRGRARALWRTGISDPQRRQAVTRSISGYLSTKGYLRAQTQSRVLYPAVNRKLVEFHVASGIRYRNVDTVIQGVSPERRTEVSTLLRQRGLNEAIHTDARRLTETIARHYEERGYLAIRVDAPVYALDERHATGRVIIPIREGPVYRVGRLLFSGNASLPDSDLLSSLPLQSGGVLEPARVSRSVESIRQKYGRLGFLYASVDHDVVRDDERGTADISFDIVENRQTLIGVIKVEGNSHTNAGFALGQLLIAEGRPADSTLVRDSVQNLSRAGAYASADIELRPRSEPAGSVPRPEIADLVVAITEPKPFRVQYGGMYDTDRGPGFIVDVENRNSLGTGRVVGFRTRYDSEMKEARLYVNRPVWGRRQLSTMVSAYATREQVPKQLIPTDTIGVSLQQDWRLRSKLLLSYGYRYEIQQNFLIEPGVPALPTRRVATTPLTLTFSRDSRDAFLDATRGSFISHGLDYAPAILGSDYPYIRYYFQYFKYFPLTHPSPVPFGQPARRSRLVLASGSRIGLQTGFNPEGIVLTDRFFAGGGTTVRGFKQDSLGPYLPNGVRVGGNAVLVLNEELRFPLFHMLDGVGFVDAGNVFRRVSNLSLSDLRSAAGFGLRIRNPFVVLRFDYGFKLDRRPGEKIGAFFFSVGQAF